MSIRTRLIAGFLLLFLLWGGVAALFLAQFGRLHARADAVVAAHLPRITRANLMIDLANETARTMGEVLLTDDAGERAAQRRRIAVLRGSVAAHVRWYTAQPNPPGTRRRLAAMREARRAYWAAQERFFELVDQGEATRARAFYVADVMDVQRRYVQSIDLLIRHEGDSVRVATDRTRDAFRRAHYLLLGFTVVALLLAAVVSVAVGRGILVPLAAAADIARGVASGDLAVPAVREDTRDEIGQLTHALAEMAGHVAADRRRREETESALRESETRLRELAAHGERIRERERLHVARELHDELGQLLTAMRMDLAALRMRFAHHDPDIAPHVARMNQTIDGTLRVVRDVVSSLRPGVLDAGLVAAAEWLVAATADRTGLALRLDVPARDIDLDDAVATAAFRILQEALTNVVRHAHAREVSIAIRRTSSELQLVVSDDGIGMDVAAQGTRGTFGLLGMHERAMMHGGSVHIDSTPGKGTTMRALLKTCDHQPA